MKKDSGRGFSLVEVVVMMGLAGVALPALMALVTQSCRGDWRHARLAPLELAMRNELDRLTHLPYAELESLGAKTGPADEWRSRVVPQEPGLVRVEVEARSEASGAPLVVARLVARPGAFHAGPREEAR